MRFLGFGSIGGMVGRFFGGVASPAAKAGPVGELVSLVSSAPVVRRGTGGPSGNAHQRRVIVRESERRYQAWLSGRV